MKFGRPKSTLWVLSLFVGAGLASAVVCMPDTSEMPSIEPASTTIESDTLTFVSTTSKQDSELIPLDRFLTIPDGREPVTPNLRSLDDDWNLAYAPMLLESIRFMSRRNQPSVIAFLEIKTKQQFGSDFDKWRQWIWKQKFDPHPDLGEFKSKLYRKIDSRFAEYFADTDGATIRLDEIRWGGVVRDGIPPLSKPEMIKPADATYLADSDVVFGIKINGDARCYPKRVLAWHEMFKDTIGGESICGVY